MGTAAALLKWANSQLGTVEKPPNSNHIRYWDDVGMSGYNAVIKDGVVIKKGQPWCAALVLAGLERIGVGPVTRAVYVPRIRSDYRNAGHLHPIAEALPGDQVLFNFGNGTTETHTGIVESIDTKAHTVTSIDGNTSRSAGHDVDGGGVWRRTRPWSVTWGVGRPDFDPIAPPAPIPFPGDHMRRIDIRVPGLDDDGHGYTDLFDVKAGHVVSVRINSDGYKPTPEGDGDQDQDGHARIEWFGKPKAPAFDARIWVTDP